jgi:hypothetical protein
VGRAPARISRREWPCPRSRAGGRPTPPARPRRTSSTGTGSSRTRRRGRAARHDDDDRYGSVSLQQFAHSIGLSLYDGYWVSRAYSLDYPAELEENQYFAIETFAGHAGLQQTVRLEENVLVTADGPVIFTLHPHDERMFA